MGDEEEEQEEEERRKRMKLVRVGGNGGSVSGLIQFGKLEMDVVRGAGKEQRGCESLHLLEVDTEVVDVPFAQSGSHSVLALTVLRTHYAAGSRTCFCFIFLSEHDFVHTIHAVGATAVAFLRLFC